MKQHGSLSVGVDNYVLNDDYTRTKPPTVTEETLTFRILYHSDSSHTVLVSYEEISYIVIYTDFTDASFTVINNDRFEADLKD